MNGVHLEFLVPQKVHVLVQVFVDGSADDSWGHSQDVSWTVNDGWSNDDQIQSWDLLQFLLCFRFGLGQLGPRFDLGVFRAWFLRISISTTDSVPCQQCKLEKWRPQ